MTALATRMTTEEFLALPEDGKRRWLIDGELHEEDMTTRNKLHSIVVSNVTTALNVWRRKLPKSQGRVVSGESGVRFDEEEDTVFGVDVAYISQEVYETESSSTLVVGLPSVIVEVLSPSNTEESKKAKLAAYRKAGVPLVWFVDPDEETVTIYKLGAKPTLVNASQMLTGEDVLPGFSIPVADLFN